MQCAQFGHLMTPNNTNNYYSSVLNTCMLNILVDFEPVAFRACFLVCNSRIQFMK